MRELLNKISEHNVVVEVVDGKLKVFAKQGNIAPELLSAIKEQKEELIRFLSGINQQTINEALQVNIPAIPPAESYVLSSGQRRMWILSQFEEGSVAYNMVGSYVFEGDLNRPAFEAALYALMERHENLRTVFKENEEGEVRQYVLPVAETGFAMQYVDLRQEPQPAAKLNELLQVNKLQPYNLAEGPLLRAVFYQLADAQWVFGYGLHHIISDGWSGGVMVNELLVLYNAFSNNQPNPLPPLRIQYKDYAAWQQAQLSGESLKKHATYWQAQFSGELPVLNMPSDYIRPAIKTYNGGIVGNHFSMQLTKGLKALVHEQGCTLFMGTLALVNTLLHRYTGQEDIILGTPIAGREHADLHNQIGLYINTLALRTQFKGTDGFKALLAQVKQVTLGAFEHQVYPFDELVDDLNLKRDLSRNALFDVMVVLQNSDKQISTNGSEQQTMGGVNVGGYEGVEDLVSKLDITFTFEEVGEELYYSIQYNTDIFNKSTIERLAKHLNKLVAIVTAQPLTPIQRLDYLLPEEKEQLLVAFNDTARVTPQNKTIIDLFEEQVSLHPNATAVLVDDSAFSYADMNAVANQLAAHLLRHHHIQPNDRVGICLHRSHWLIVAIIGIMKSGGAYVPIDPDYPQERIDYMVADSGCKVVIDEAFINQFQATQAAYDTANPAPLATLESLAYVIYTSGSTGKPKGVMIQHRNVVSFFGNFADKFGLQPGLAMGGTTNYTFDISVLELIGCLANGIQLVLVTTNGPEDILAQIDKGRITALQVTPSRLAQLLELDNGTLAKLKVLLVGGEALGQQQYRLLKEMTNTLVVNVYGPTEATIWTTSLVVSNSHSLSIGKPLYNETIYILDEKLGLVSIGVPGEICIGGDGLAVGYLNREELTAEKFIANPFVEGQRIYKTGDLGRWLLDGNIEFLGRLDQQVKVRGYRIELGEIEAVLQALPYIDSAVVHAYGNAAGEKELAAFMVSGQPIDIPTIKSALGGLLPAYMVPTHFVQMDVFPLNSSGKVDRKQLPNPIEGGLGIHTRVEYVAPRNETESNLVDIWSEILGREKEAISVKDNFFELGGHSLKATRLVGRIYKQMGVKLPLQDLFIKAVLEEQALLIEQKGQTEYKAIEPLPPAPHYALSPSQRRLWILSQFEESNVAYNMPGMYVFDSNINRDALTKAFDTLIERHESLRTVFKEDEQGEVRQFIVTPSALGFRISYTDLRGQGNVDELLTALLQQQASLAFDLANGPLLRASLYETDGDKLVLGYVLHHIISDGVSMNILMQEVMQLYMAFSNGLGNPLPPLRIQYKDYAAWQILQLSGEPLQQHQAYWHQQFAGEIPVLDLPGDKKRPALKTYNGGSIPHFISPEITNGLKKLAQEQGGTLFMGLVAAVNALLYKYTQQQDIIIGTQIAGRGHADLENQIGFYLNTLALRTQFDANADFKELLKKVKAVTLGALEHQVYPFDELVNELPLHREMSRSALFDVSLVLHNTEVDESQIGLTAPTEAGEGLQATGFGTGAAPTSKFDLAFGFTETEGGLMVNLVFNTDIYLPETAVRMMVHLQQLLQAIVHQPNQALATMDCLNAEEKEQQLITFNNTTVAYPNDKTIAELFTAQVNQTPDAPAVIFGQKQLSYAELNEKADRLAHYLQTNHQVQYDDLVGIMLDRSENMIVAILGVLKSGAGYVPIDSEYPKGRKSFILKDTGVKALITQTDYIFELEYYDGPVIALDVQMEAMEAPSAPVVAFTGPDNLAYVMYTSGSTGVPKGVLIKQRSVVRLVKNTNYVQLAPTDNVLGLSNFAFDGSTFDIYAALLNGGTVHIALKEQLLDFNDLANIIDKNDITLFFITTALFNSLVDVGFANFAKLKYVLFGGERVSVAHVKKFRAAYPNVQLLHVYGPTENTTFSTYFNVGEVSDDAVTIPIGSGIANSQCYILNPTDHCLPLLPLGAVGEIAVGGDGLAIGYLNQPELTAEKFVDNPFVPGGRLYKTGDYGRWLPDGSIAFTDRRDAQVKIRGHRIELGEIETALQGHPAIEMAVVVALPNKQGDKEVVAYVVAKETLNATALATYLGASLPNYMVPAQFVQMEALPLNANGKVDIKALPNPTESGLGTGVEMVAPRNATEEKLLAIWQEILDRDTISVKDNFFDLGGHSLKATKLASQVHKQLEVRLELKDIFTKPVLEDMALLIDEAAKQVFVSIEPVAPQADYVLSSSQRRMWLLSQIEEANVAYNMPGVYFFDGDLDTVAFDEAFASLIQRHEILRTIFKQNENGEVRQVILDAEQTGFSVSHVDLRGEKDTDAVLGQYVYQQSNQPFNLATGPLLRAAVYQAADDKRLFVYCMHHIISDGWSKGILVAELLALYNAYKQDQPNPLTPLRIQYKDYAAWQQDQLSGENLQQHKNYWLQHFEGELPVLDLPNDKMRPAIQTFNGAMVGKVIKATVSQGIKAMAQQQGATLFMGLLAGVNALFNRYTRQEDIVLGTPIAGRVHADLHDQIGFYVNTLALRSRFSSSDSFHQLLQNVKTVTLGAYEHQVYPFDELVDNLEVQRDMSRNQLFDVMVILQNNDAPDGGAAMPQLGGMQVSDYGAGGSHVVSKFDMTLAFGEVGDEIHLNIEYNTDIYSAAIVTQLANHLEQLLEQALQQPDTAIGLLDYLTTAEKEYLLTGINNTASAYDKQATMVDLIEAQAAATTDNIALFYGDETMTYAQLNEAANRVAHYLRKEHNVKADDLVGIQLERTGNMVAAMLGVLKSGAAYVPIDPAYPQERIDYLINDSQCKLLIDGKAMEAFMQGADNYPASNPSKVLLPNHLAYIIYTSGSTGQPKGVMIEHGNVTAFMHWAKKEFEGTDYEVIFAATSICFDVSIFEIFYTLTTGKPIRLLPDALAIPQYLGSHKRIMLNTVPSVVGALIREKADFSNVTILNMAGEAIPEQYAAHFDADKIPMRNFYGPSEDTTYSTIYHLKNNAPILIGRPIDNSQAYIVSPMGQLCPVGVVGEIWIGGDGVSRGYLHRPELTAQKYLDNPFVPGGGKVYKTGDLGRWLPDGNLGLSGRSDTQVKVRGYRIELGEVEIALQSHPSIETAAVVVKAMADGDKEMVAYICGKETLTADMLRDYLGKFLPGYMVPGHFVQLDTMPLTLNGKIDRKKLPNPEGLGMSSGVEYIAPRNETEEKLLAIWQELLGKETISVKDNFFGLGGHSLKATRLSSEIYKAFEVKLGLKDLFVATTLEQQAALIEQTATTSFSAIEPAPVQAIYPLSAAQRRLWVLSQFHDGNLAYNMPGTYVFEGELNTAALQQAYRALIERHEVLRTVFKQDEQGNVGQLILSGQDDKFTLAINDWRGQNEMDAKVAALVQQQSATAFDLTNGPLIRAALYQVADTHWVFTYCMHHIISDGWSMGILVTELLQLYNAFSNNQPNPLPALRIQYKDYAVWQQQQLGAEGLAQHKQYWLQQFAGELPVLDMPGDKPRPAMKTYRGGAVGKHLTPRLSTAIQSLAQQEGGTLFMAMMAAVNTLFHRYTGQEDIVLGTSLAGREHSDLHNQIGFYINTLALRTRFSGSYSYRQLLHYVKEVTLGAYSHQVYPFDELVEDLQLQRDLSRSPLFDVMLVLQNNENPAEDKGMQLDGVNVAAYGSGENTTSRFDFTFNFSQEGDALKIGLEYNSDIYTEQTAGQMVLHFEQLLEQAVQHPDTAIESLDYLTAAEKAQLTEQFNDTAVDYPAGKAIVTVFEEQAALTPDKIALVFESTQFTYQQLNEEANRWGHYIRSNYNIQANDIIGIELQQRSHLTILSILGILKAGAAYLPLDADYPEERRRYMINDCRCKWVIDDAAIETIIAAKDAQPADNPVTLTDAQSMAYVMYTSGSTGMPKGVMIKNSGVVRLVKPLKYMGFTGNETLLSAGALSFDATTFEFWSMLLNGGKLIMSRRETLLDPQLLEAAIAQYGVDTMWFTTGWLNQLVDTGATLFKYLHTIKVGGDRLSPYHIRTLKARYPQQTIVNGYGPTENTGASCCYTIAEVADNIPVGKPIDNSTAWVLDNQLQLVPVGVVGELCVGGAGLALGYLNKPDLTAEKFVPNPYRPGELMYKTGDLVRWLPDGNVEFKGRKDDQVKIAGYRIELGEVEAALQRHPQVDSAVVMAKLNTTGEKVLVAYYVATDTVDPTTLRAFMAASLPAYMIPWHFMPIAAMPLNANGKVDRKQLPEPQGFEAQRSVAYVAPTTATQTKLVQVWQEILGKENISIKDNFFDLGGHSLKATRLASYIHKLFDAPVTLEELFVNPVLEDQASLIDQSEKKVFVAIEPVPVQDSYPLSSAQRRLWVLSQFEEGNLAYNMPAVYTLGSINAELLGKAFDALIERHEILRTIIKEADTGEVRQYILPADQTGFAVQQYDMRSRADAEDAIPMILHANLATPFDLSTGPLLRVSLLHVADEQWVLALNMHHIISDGWSMEVLVNELMLLYHTIGTNQPNPLPPLRIQYKDYASWQQQQLTSGALEVHKNYWLQQFAGELPVLDLAGDKMRPAVKTYNGANQHFAINAAVSKQLKELGRERGATLFMGLLAGVNALLHRYTGQEDIILGTPIAGRQHADLDNQIGFYINTLALRTQFSAQDGFGQLLQKAKTVTMGAYEHQAYPFDELVDTLDLQRDMSRSPLFDVLVVLQNNEDSTAGTPAPSNETGMTNYSSESKLSKFDITFTFVEAGEEIRTIIEYNTDIYSGTSIAQLGQHFLQLLGQAVAHPDTAVGLLDYLTADETQYLLTGINDTASEYDKTISIVDLIEQQAAATPDNIAVIFGNNQLTYRQLNEAANQVAYYLRQEQAAKADDLIGIQLERSESMVAVMLGVLKSGAAYVPIDTAYPQERINYLINDSKCKYLIDEKAWTALQAKAAGYSKENPAKVIQPGDLAYIIYTSGSTGQPKGVMIQHGNVTAFMHWAKKEFGKADYEILFAGTSICFDISIFEIFYTLTTGKHLRLLPDALAIPQYLKAHQKILINTVPSVVGTLIREQADFSNVTILNMAGEAIPEQYVAHFDAAKIPLYNFYGPSEDTTYSTYYRIQNNAPILIGRPIDNSQVYIVSPLAQLCPVGVVGEIWIGGDGVSRGYLHRPELTAEKYLDNSFGPGRIYKTGDLGRWLPDGNLALSGRRDTQVKLRGYRIELGEVEAALQSYPAVELAAVLVLANVEGEKDMVAYLMAKEPLQLDQLQAHLAGMLPGYMVPNYFVQLETMPLTLNGKIDRKKLPVPTEGAMGSGVEMVAPRNETEQLLLNVWKEVLQKDKISVKDNFFHIGGHSLKGMKLLGILNRKHGFNLKVQDIYNQPTIELMAQQKGSTSGVFLLNQENVEIKNNIYFIPPIFGNSILFKPLAETLTGHFNCYGMQYSGLHKGEARYTSIEQAAEELSKEILLRQQDGNFIIFGFSMGATIAFEMAKILEKKFKTVNLILVDRGVETTAGILPGDTSVEEDVDWLLQRFPAAGAAHPGGEATLRPFLAHNTKLMKAYKQKGKIKGGIIALEAEENKEKTNMKKWKSFTKGGLGQIFIKGDHWRAFLPINFPYFHQAIGMLFPKK